MYEKFPECQEYIFEDILVEFFMYKTTVKPV